MSSRTIYIFGLLALAGAALGSNHKSTDSIQIYGQDSDGTRVLQTDASSILSIKSQYQNNIAFTENSDAGLATGGLYKTDRAAATNGDFMVAAVDIKGNTMIAGADAENEPATAAPVAIAGRYDASPRNLSDHDVGTIAVNSAGHVLTTNAVSLCTGCTQGNILITETNADTATYYPTNNAIDCTTKTHGLLYGTLAVADNTVELYGSLDDAETNMVLLKTWVAGTTNVYMEINPLLTPYLKVKVIEGGTALSTGNVLTLLCR